MTQLNYFDMVCLNNTCQITIPVHLQDIPSSDSANSGSKENGSAQEGNVLNQVRLTIWNLFLYIIFHFSAYLS